MRFSSRWRRRFKGAFIFGVIVSVGAVFFVMYGMPLPEAFMEPIPSTTKIFDRNGVLLYELLEQHQGRTSYIELAQVAPSFREAILAAEDARFYKNAGVDWRAIARALFLNVREQQVISGGSTITQQLVRNILGTNTARTVGHKLKEAVYAVRVTQVFSKDKILEMYLNRVYYGYQNYGVQAAALGYFDKPARDLDLAESAFLAGLPQAPSLYDPFTRFETAKKRQERILELMVRHEFISREAAEAAKAEPLRLSKGVLHPIQAPHFVHFVISQLKARYGDELYRGLAITTTLDLGLEREVEEIARGAVQKLKPHNVSNAAVVVMDPANGQLLALSGGVDFFKKEIDGAVNSALSLRQPGSTIKPFTYTLAFERGWGPATLIRDEPVRFFTAQGTPYTPKNFDFEFHGLVTVREALGNSYNIPAIKTAQYVGVPALLARLRKAGFATLTKVPEHYGLALTLGDGEVRLLDLVGAYSAFARAGERIAPITVLRVARGSAVLEEQQRGDAQQIFSPAIAYLITDILKDKYARLAEFGLENVLELDRPAAVKTGTSRNFKDNWTIGYSPDRIVGVWVGNNDGSAMEGVSGAVGAAPIWQAVMSAAHQGILPRTFVVPAGVEKQPVCLGKPCHLQEEWFLSGAETAALADPASSLRIVKPFDGDTFKLSSLLKDGSGEIKFEAESTAGAVVERIAWYVNEDWVGEGDAVFWKPSAGTFRVKAKWVGDDGGVKEQSSIRIVVQ